MKSIRYYIKKVMRPYGKSHFLLSYVGKTHVAVLDVGCGNNSVSAVKRNCPNCYYIGIDVGDYNLDEESKSLMDEYHVVSAEDFAEEIGKYKESVDVVISSHNIEHCNEPQKVLENMILSLKNEGNIYLAFPSEKSVNFPSRKGALNFYDDKTHSWCPKWDDIMKTLKKNNIQITYACKNNRPLLLKIVGRMNEGKSKKENRILKRTWEYYGFESIIWGTLRK